MTRTMSSIAAALAALAMVAPVATAMPQREAVEPSAATPQQDRRSPDARDASIQPRAGSVTAPGQDVRSPDARDAAAPSVREPVAVDAAPVGDDGGIPPLVYILAGLTASAMLAAGMSVAVRTSRRARVGA